MAKTDSQAKAQVYLDHNATTPVAENVKAKLLTWVENWGNPSSIHNSGRGPKTLLREARDRVARFIGASPLEIVFTSGGSESNNYALKGFYETLQNPKPLQAANLRRRFLVSSVEHPSVMKTLEYLRDRHESSDGGITVDIIPVSRKGEIDLEIYKKLLGPDVALVSVMYANNETGNVFPIREMADLAHQSGAIFHSDCVQALGKIPLNVHELGVDLASFSGHKFYSLKGAGALYIRKGLSLESLIHGGGQERHRRGGTENILAIAAMGFMCEQKEAVVEKASSMQALRDHFEARVLAEIPCARRTGSESPRLPNTSSLVIPGIDGETLLMSLDMRGFSVSTGAACSSGSPEPSPVLLAMGLTRKEAQSSLRVGLGWGTTSDDINDFCDALKQAVTLLREINTRAALDESELATGTFPHEEFSGIQHD
jgi:cysteine desulfurase